MCSTNAGEKVGVGVVGREGEGGGRISSKKKENGEEGENEKDPKTTKNKHLFWTFRGSCVSLCVSVSEASLSSPSIFSSVCLCRYISIRCS